jgi:DNA-binding response OmpR family regulator
LLKGFGLSVVSARNGEELIEVMKRAEPIDLALVDYHLDDGVLGLDLIQTHLEVVTKPFPVIIVTADDSDGIKNTVAAAGFRFMSKPVNPGRLRAVIAALLKRAKPQAAVSGVESAAS